MYTLYARNGAGSMAPEALLAACGADYKLIVVERMPDGSFPEYFHRINPKAEVPTLVLPDDSVMTESAAMMIYLADLFPAAAEPVFTGRRRQIVTPAMREFLRERMERVYRELEDQWPDLAAEFADQPTHDHSRHAELREEIA